jgi:hypothetical protein
MQHARERQQCPGDGGSNRQCAHQQRSQHHDCRGDQRIRPLQHALRHLQKGAEQNSAGEGQHGQPAERLRRRNQADRHKRRHICDPCQRLQQPREQSLHKRVRHDR